jgi:glycosyltransferase 2 family protein
VTGASIETPRYTLRRWLPWLGALIGVAALAWVLRGFDLSRFLTIATGIDARFVLMVSLTIIIEQIVRGWKWRQLLWPLRSIGSVYLFGAVMAGYFLAIIVPFGFGTVARSWLVARREDLKFSTVLATVALDRLTDGVVFACLVPAAVLFVAFPDPSGVRAGLIWGGAGSFILFVALLAGLAIYRRQALDPAARLIRLVDRLPSRLALPMRRLAASFAEGIIWPREIWRGGAIVLASVVMKLFAAMQFVGAGLAFGIRLHPAEYLFLMVFLGLLVIVGHFARIAGGFIIGAVFALGLFGVPQEEALAMSLIVQASNLLSIACVGAFALWLQGVALADVRMGTEGAVDARRG